MSSESHSSSAPDESSESSSSSAFEGVIRRPEHAAKGSKGPKITELSTAQRKLTLTKLHRELRGGSPRPSIYFLARRADPRKPLSRQLKKGDEVVIICPQKKKREVDLPPEKQENRKRARPAVADDSKEDPRRPAVRLSPAQPDFLDPHFSLSSEPPFRASLFIHPPSWLSHDLMHRRSTSPMLEKGKSWWLCS